MSEVVNVPVIGINYTTNLGEATQLVLQTHIPQDVSPQAMNDLLDRLAKAADRQKARTELPSLQDLLANAEKMAKRAQEDRARIDAELEVATNGEGRRIRKLTPAQQQDREHAGIAIDRYKTDIANLRAKIDKAESMLGG